MILHIREAAQGAAGYEVDTVYFGGGTPSFFGAGGLSKIFAEIDRRFDVSRDAEVTLEANPDSVTLPMLTHLRRAGFNRISIGVQSDDDAQLKALGRPHNYRQAQQAVSLSRRAGFDNVSVDLMFGLPNQSREQWMQTLRNVIDLKADHISCYGLKVEPGTKLWSYKDCANLPDDDAQADMYFYAVETLEQFGYHQYEISNFAHDGFICRHNMKYWVGDEYLGFGPCAASDFAGGASPLSRIWKTISRASWKRASSCRSLSWSRCVSVRANTSCSVCGRSTASRRANIQDPSSCRSSRSRRFF